MRLYAPFDGKKYYEGELLSFDGENAAVRTEEGEKIFSVNKIAKISLYIEV